MSPAFQTELSSLSTKGCGRSTKGVFGCQVLLAVMSNASSPVKAAMTVTRPSRGLNVRAAPRQTPS